MYIRMNTCIYLSTRIQDKCVLDIEYLTHTGWRRLIGSPKLQIIFHKRATEYRSLLRKMTYKDKGSYESSPPCSLFHAQISNCILHIETNITTG